jgi:hypothetical protein
LGKKQQKQQNPAKDHAPKSTKCAVVQLYRKRNGVKPKESKMKSTPTKPSIARFVRAGKETAFSARTISTGRHAERYGYVNRALPDAELDAFVDALARRIASFDRRAIAAAKNLVNHVSLPSADRLLAAITSFETALTWPEAQQRIQNVLQRGLQRDSDFETRWPEVLGTLLET